MLKLYSEVPQIKKDNAQRMPLQRAGNSIKKYGKPQKHVMPLRTSVLLSRVQAKLSQSASPIAQLKRVPSRKSVLQGKEDTRSIQKQLNEIMAARDQRFATKSSGN